MKRTKENKKSLLACGMSLVLCLAMLIGTTFAWFSDTVSNKGNKIQAGNLKIGFYVSDNESTALPNIGATNQDTPKVGDWTDLKHDVSPVFTMGTAQAPAQPGDKLTKYIAIRNEGTIALKYYLDFIVTDGGLGDAVTFDFTEIAPNAGSKTTLTGSQLAEQKVNGSSGAKGEFTVYKMELAFNESAGNTYQDGSFSVDLNLTATQNKAGAIDTLVKAKTIEDVKSAESNATVVLMNDIIDYETDLAFSHFLNIDLNGYTLISKSFVVNTEAVGTIDISNNSSTKNTGNFLGCVDGNVELVIPNGSVNVNAPVGVVSSKNVVFNTAPNTARINVSPFVLTFNNGEVDKTDATPEITLENGRMIVAEDVSLGNVTVAQGAEKVTIENNGSIGKLDNKSDNEVVVDNNSPDETDGNVTVSGSWDGKTTTEVTPVGNVYSVSNGEELAWISQQVKGGKNFAGKTIKLTNGIKLGGNEWTAIGTNTAFAGNFDGQGNAIFGLYINKPKISSQGLFGNVSGGKIENVVVKGADVSGYSQVGVLIGNYTITGQVAEINNCRVENSKLSGSYATAPIAGLVGTTKSGSATFTADNNDVYNTNIQWVTTSNYMYSGGVFGRLLGGKANSVFNITNSDVSKLTSSSINLTEYYVNGFTGGIVGGTYTSGGEGFNSATFNVASCTVKDSIIDGSTASDEYGKGDSYVGGIIGYTQYGFNNIKNCTGNNLTIKGNNAVGGVAGLLTIDSNQIVIDNVNMTNINILTGKSGAEIYGAGLVPKTTNVTFDGTITVLKK